MIYDDVIYADIIYAHVIYAYVIYAHVIYAYVIYAHVIHAYVIETSVESRINTNMVQRKYNDRINYVTKTYLILKWKVRILREVK